MKHVVFLGICCLTAWSGCNKISPGGEHEQSATAASAGPASGTSQGASGAVAITVGTYGYQPDSVHAKAGQPLRLNFTRTSDEGCGQQLVFPSLGIHKDLPLNKVVAVDITMPASGSVAFTCGMNMFRGAIVAQ